MLIGAMNHPARDVLSEIRWMSEMKLDFIDLTIEPPSAAASAIPVKQLAAALQETGMHAVGHTAYYLPLCCPFESIRKAAVDELKRCIEVFAELKVEWVNIHPDRHAPFHDRKFIIEKNIQSLLELLPFARAHQIGLMIENLPGEYNTVEQLGDLLDPLPDLGLHLDIGHSNLMVTRNTAPEIIRVYGSRLRHVHLHDNKGGTADLHLPLGTGTLELKKHIRALKESQYDGTITLEVFSPDSKYLAYSRDVLRKLWDEMDQLQDCDSQMPAHQC